ncbi:MAG: cyclodeaminase/cyclohydrolase family protein [Candidatus Izimaplasma sp.]|nr:cyclodeaminase/cyclohydrolase family protein [Candidatus Izimaplasma bacterium]
MKLVDLSLVDFSNEVDSKSPAPGGGSVSAMAGSVGASLTRMVGHLTVNKKKFRALDEETQKQFNKILKEFLQIKEELLLMVDKDTEAFNLIMAGYKLSKDTIEEKQIRKQKILEGTIEAIKVPFGIAQLSIKALKHMDYILKYGNKNTLSDIGVSTLMLYTSLEGAILNVKINISGLNDQSMIDQYSNSIALMLQEGKEIKNAILSEIHNSL